MIYTVRWSGTRLPDSKFSTWDGKVSDHDDTPALIRTLGKDVGYVIEYLKSLGATVQADMTTCSAGPFLEKDK